MGAAIARSYGVTPKAIRDIWTLKTWADITLAYDTSESTSSQQEVVPNKRKKHDNYFFRQNVSDGLEIQHPSELVSGVAFSEGPTDTQSIRTDPQVIVIPAPVNCACPVRFKSISYKQIESIAAKRKTSLAAFSGVPLQSSRRRSNAAPSTTKFAKSNCGAAPSAPSYADMAKNLIDSTASPSRTEPLTTALPGNALSLVEGPTRPPPLHIDLHDNCPRWLQLNSDPLPPAKPPAPAGLGGLSPLGGGSAGKWPPSEQPPAPAGLEPLYARSAPGPV